MNRSDGIPITYAPDRVEVGRVFRIAFDVPEDQVPLNLAAPDGVELIDRSAPERAGDTLFYFRAHREQRGARIRVDGRSAGAEVSVDCLSRMRLLERREQGAIRLPRRWPVWEELDELKSSRTIWRRDDLERALAWGRRHPESVSQQRESAERWLAKPDDFLWNLLPQTQFSRHHFVNLKVGCPIHGDAIFKHGGYYPWSVDVEGMPYKVRCPVGGEWYPSNDLAADDFTSGAYPDDGHGCVQGAVKWNFVPVYQNARGYHFTGGVRTLADAYLQTGDAALLHKLRVMLLRIADEWGYLSGKLEDRFRFGEPFLLERGRWPRTATKVADLNASGMVNYSINLAFDLVTYATAYDLVWEGIDGDRDLLRLAQDRLGLGSGEEVRRYIESHLLCVGAQTAIDGGAHSNLPHPQLGLANLILAMNYRSGVRLLDWLWNGGGQMRYWLPNFFFRDGAAYESTGSYNAMHVDDTPVIGDRLDRLRDLRPDECRQVGVERFAADPKMKLLYTHMAELICAGRMHPQVGDGGLGPTPDNPPLEKAYSMSEKTNAYEHAFETYGDPLFAQVLWAGQGYEPGMESRLEREEVEAVIQRVGPDVDLESQIFDGYGIAVLRSGSGDRARALWLRYGQARAHRHDDMLDIGLLAHRRSLMAHLGYPYSWASHGVWDGNWLTHFRVKVHGVDAKPVEVSEGSAKGEGVYSGGCYYKTGKESPEDSIFYSGALRSFAAAPSFQAAHADGEAFYDLKFPPYTYAPDQRREGGWVKRRYQVLRDQIYSRWVGLIDVGEQDFYVLDIHRARGGNEHWWSFHGPCGEAVVDGLDNLEAWPDGSPAGKEIGYGETDKTNGHDASRHSLTYLYDCRRAEVNRPWKATWRLSGNSNLELRLRQLAADGEVMLGRGKPPISSMENPPYELTWTLAHRRGPAPLSSQFVSTIEVSEAGCEILKRVERVPARGTGAFEPVAVRATTAEWTDLVVNAADGGVVTPESGDWSFEGQYGFARSGKSGVEQVSLTGGRRFVTQDVGVVETTGTLTAEVLGGDFDKRQVVVSAIPEPPEALVGHHVRFDSENRSSTYRVLAAESAAEGVCLSLDVDLRIGAGTADGFEQGAIISHTHFPLAGFRYYQGACLQAAGGSIFVVDHIESEVVAQTDSGFQPKSWIVLESVDGRDVDPHQLSSACGQGGSFVIYDVGTGDRATFPLTSYMRRVDVATWEAYIGPETVLALGKLPPGTAQVWRGNRRWDLPIKEGESGLSTVDLGGAGIGMGQVEISLR